MLASMVLEHKTTGTYAKLLCNAVRCQLSLGPPLQLAKMLHKSVALGRRIEGWYSCICAAQNYNTAPHASLITALVAAAQVGPSCA